MGFEGSTLLVLERNTAAIFTMMVDDGNPQLNLNRRGWVDLGMAQKVKDLIVQEQRKLIRISLNSMF
jgi:hypothetical protein